MEYIKSELDESEREEFFRLKKVQAKKAKVKAEKEAALEAKELGAGGDDGSAMLGGTRLTNTHDNSIF